MQKNLERNNNLGQSKHRSPLGQESVYNVTCTLPSYLLELFQHGSTGECKVLKSLGHYFSILCALSTPASFKKLLFSSVGLWTVWRHAACAPGHAASLSPETALKILLCQMLHDWAYANHLTHLCHLPSRTEGYKLILGAAVGSDMFLRNSCYEISIF